jgi:integrase
MGYRYTLGYTGGYTMTSTQRYVQWLESKKCWRFRRRIPGHLRDLIGQTEWIETLPARNRTEAERLAIPHIDETNRIIRLAERGNWPPIGDTDIEALALGWWDWFQGEPIKRWVDRCGGNEPLDPHEWALAGEDDLSRSMRRFLVGPRTWHFPKPEHLRPTPVQAKVEAFLADPDRSGQLLRNEDAMIRLKRQCRILHHQCLGGFLGEIDEREIALSSVLTAIHAQDADPRQIVAEMVVGPITRPPTPSPVDPPHLPQAKPTTAYSFNDLIEFWAAERKHLGPKTVYEVQHIAGKLAKFLGHEESTVKERVNAAKAYELTKDDFIRWKEALINASLSAPTIEKNLNMIKAVFELAAANNKIAVDPTRGVTYEAKRNPRKTRFGYSNADAAKILLAARRERDPLRRWTPWVCAFTGCRLDEIVSAMVCDIERVGDIYVLAISLDNRDADASLKTPDSARKVPLHPLLIDEGFIRYVSTLPKDGPLFPDVPPDRFGRRGGTAT